MNGFHRIARDDENDTRLFDTLEEYVLDSYPNPQRVGCLDRDLLRQIVETPEQLDLTNPKFLHVFKCAECTRDLRELRRAREARLQQGATCSPALVESPFGATASWPKRAAEAASKACLTLLRLAKKLKSVIR